MRVSCDGDAAASADGASLLGPPVPHCRTLTPQRPHSSPIRNRAIQGHPQKLESQGSVSSTLSLQQVMTTVLDPEQPPSGSQALRPFVRLSHRRRARGSGLPALPSSPGGRRFPLEPSLTFLPHSHWLHHTPCAWQSPCQSRCSSHTTPHSPTPRHPHDRPCPRTFDFGISTLTSSSPLTVSGHQGAVAMAGGGWI